MHDSSGTTGYQAIPDLIDRLDAYARHFTFAAIVVNLGSRIALVLASAPDRLTTLTSLVQIDGAPLGIVASRGNAQRRMCCALPLAEHAGNGDALVLLVALCESLDTICRGHLRPRPQALSKN